MPFYKGQKFTEEHKRKLSESHKGPRPWWRGENHTFWKGENAGYNAKHAWIRTYFGTPGTCEHCGESGLTGQKINWANISGEHKREREDWLRLCVSCHRKYDEVVRERDKTTGRFLKKFGYSA